MAKILNLVNKWKEELESEGVVLPENILKEILSIFAFNLNLKNKDIAYKGLIFYGLPGTGKTFLMKKFEKILKKEYGENFEIVKIAGPEIFSEYYGKTERSLRNKFRLAEEIGEKSGFGFIYIDELDSIAPRRDIVRGELEPRLVGQLLTLMDGIREKNVMVIGSTNRLHALDPALRRPGRFDKEVEFSLPSKELRKKLLRFYMKEISDLLVNEIANLTEGFTPADIKLLIREVERKRSLYNDKYLRRYI